MIKFTSHPFPELTLERLYNILALRAEIFIVGQQCVYQDIDGQDNEAIHLLGTENNTLVAYARIFPPDVDDKNIVFGRLAVADSARGKGYGKLLMQALIKYCDENFPDATIKCSAQHYLLRFYNEFGFNAYGDVYDEDGIPHIGMIRL